MVSCTSSTLIYNKKNYPYPCPPNKDSNYDRMKVLNTLAAYLNTSIPEFSLQDSTRGFSVTSDGRTMRFFVWDLVDTLNQDFRQCIEFSEGHIYHFTHGGYSGSFSHIAYLEEGEIIIFESINCKNRGQHSLEDVLSFLNQKLEGNPQKKEIIINVKNYRHFGYYFGKELRSLGCEEY